MFCKKCGKELSETANFCPQCGSTTEVTEEAKEAVEAVEEATAEAKEEAAAVQAEETPAVTIAEMESEAAKTAVAVEERPEEKTEAPVQQEATAENISLGVYPEEAEKPAKKSKTGIIIGASAAVAVAGAAAVGYFCFSNEIMHLFMGDAGFAGMVESNSMDYISGGNLDTDELDTALADYAETIFYGEEMEEAELSKTMLDEMFAVSGNSSVTITTKVDPGMILALADTDGLFDLFNLEFGMEAVQGDDCNRFSYALIENGERTIGADLFINDEDIAMLLPELTGQTFIVEPEKDESEEAPKEKQEFSEAEMKRIREKLVDIYNNNLKNAGIEYVKGGTELVVSGAPVDSERVIVKFSAENLNAMLKEMGDFLRNDEYLRNYYVTATEEEITEYEKSFDEAEYDGTASLTIETYITDHAKVTGKKIILTETDPETSETFDLNFETTLGNCDFYIGDEDLYITLTQRKTDETSGIMELTVDGEELGAPLVLEVSYTDAGVAEYCGQPVNTGTYLLKVSEKDEFFDYIAKESQNEEGYDSDMMMVEEVDPTSDMDTAAILGMLKDIEIETSVKCDGNSVSSSFAMNIPLFFEISFTADVKPLENAEKPVMPDCSDAIVMNEDFEAEDYPELSKEVGEKFLIVAEKSEFIGKIMELAGIEF